MRKLMLLFVLLLLASPLAADEAEGGCSWVNQVCEERCVDPYRQCTHSPQGFDGELCWEQFEWCMDSCASDFWCGYRSV